MDNLNELLQEELGDILSAENQIVDALPEMISACDSAELKEALEMHLNETRGQVQRLNKIFSMLGFDRKEKFCKGMKGLIDEGREAIKEFNKSPLRDAAIISKAKRIEHYEISAYGTMRTLANELDLGEVADLLQDSLDEERNADKKLSKLAEGGLLKSGINYLANEK